MARDTDEAERFTAYARRAHREALREIERNRRTWYAPARHEHGADEWLVYAAIWLIVALVIAALAVPMVRP